MKNKSITIISIICIVVFNIYFFSFYSTDLVISSAKKEVSQGNIYIVSSSDEEIVNFYKLINPFVLSDKQYASFLADDWLWHDFKDDYIIDANFAKYNNNYFIKGKIPIVEYIPNMISYPSKKYDKLVKQSKKQVLFINKKKDVNFLPLKDIVLTKPTYVALNVIKINDTMHYIFKYKSDNTILNNKILSIIKGYKVTENTIFEWYFLP